MSHKPASSFLPKSVHADAAPAPSTPGHFADCIYCGEPTTDGVTCERHRPRDRGSE